jgi:hypothetical protein
MVISNRSSWTPKFCPLTVIIEPDGPDEELREIDAGSKVWAFAGLEAAGRTRIAEARRRARIRRFFDLPSLPEGLALLKTASNLAHPWPNRRWSRPDGDCSPAG